MIVIHKKKKLEQYKFEEVPDFQHLRAKIAWIKRQRMKAALINIKSVDIQVKDIRQMIYSSEPQLISLYTIQNLRGPFNDEVYVNISKYKKGSDALIYALISADWLLNLEDLENSSSTELEQECFRLQVQINELKEKAKATTITNSYDIKKRLRLLEYKKSCLSEFLHQRECSNNSNEEKILAKQIVKRIS